MSVAGANKDASPSCRFYVDIGNAQALFTEVSGLQMEMEVMSYEEGGRNDFVYQLPGRTKVGNLTLKRGMTTSNDFIKWCMKVAQGTIEPRNVTVLLFDAQGKPFLRWHFAGAFPVKWAGPQLTADGTAAAIETLELAHTGMSIG
jgi:phage tail-like protein